MSTTDPLSPRALPGPGLRQWLREAFTGRPTPLLCMQVEVSSVCTCRCTYCPHTTKKDVWQSRLMSAETFAALWPLMRQCGRVHLQGWGEPFLHPRFMDFVSVARRAGCAVSTTTCGQHMDESLAAAIVEESKKRDLPITTVGNFTAVHGRGVRAALGDRACMGGNLAMMEEAGVDLGSFPARAEELAAQGKTALYFADEHQVLGLIAVADTPKPTSAAAVAGPTRPSTVSPLRRWNHLTASRVFSP